MSVFSCDDSGEIEQRTPVRRWWVAAHLDPVRETGLKHAALYDCRCITRMAIVVTVVGRVIKLDGQESWVLHVFFKR